MASKILVVPDDLKNEIEAFSRQKHRSEAEVLRDAIQSHIASNDAMVPKSLDDPKSHPRMPKSFGIASSGRTQSDQFEEWLAANWERDW